MKVNPFRPGSIVGPGIFAGRLQELKAIDQGLYQTKNGNPWHFLIHGERGIGKSSLLNITEMTANGKAPTIEDALTFNFLTVGISVEPSDHYSDLIEKIGHELSRELNEREPLKASLSSVWSFVSRWEVMGVKYTKDEDKKSEQAKLLSSLAETFITTEKKLAGKIDGILLLIDEADNAGKQAQLGEFIKVFSERLTKKGCHRVALGISGISDVIDKLKASHESSVRIFHHMRLEPLLHEETLSVIRQGLLASEKTNKIRTGITPEAAAMIAKLSEGYPHFIQQYAYSAFEADMDNNITVEDVSVGAYAENGALDQLGTRYFEGMYSDEIDSDDYRRVLKVMALDDRTEYLARKQIKEASGLKETTLNNALAALSKKHIISRHGAKSGLYKLPSGSFRAWILAKAKKENQQTLPVPPTNPGGK